jgi:hypothetical protein
MNALLLSLHIAAGGVPLSLVDLYFLRRRLIAP